MDAKYQNAVEVQKAIFNVTPQQLAKQYAKNAEGLRWMEAKAKSKGGSHNGRTAEYWGQKALEFEQTAKALCAS